MFPEAIQWTNHSFEVWVSFRPSRRSSKGPLSGYDHFIRINAGLRFAQCWWNIFWGDTMIRPFICSRELALDSVGFHGKYPFEDMSTRLNLCRLISERWRRNVTTLVWDAPNDISQFFPHWAVRFRSGGRSAAMEILYIIKYSREIYVDIMSYILT